MKLNTTRFGQLDIDEGRIINFTDDIIGFTGQRRFVLLEHQNSMFKWLQAVGNESLAFVLTDPLYTVPDYRVEVDKKQISDLDITSLNDAVLMCIVNINNGGKEVTANLLGPIIINPSRMLAKQVVLFNSKYTIKHNLIESFQRKYAENNTG